MTTPNTLTEAADWIRGWTDWRGYEEVKQALRLDSIALQQLIRLRLVTRYNDELLLSEDTIDRAEVLRLVEQSWARRVVRALRDDE